MKLSPVGADSRDLGPVVFINALVIDCFSVSIAVELRGKGQVVIWHLGILMATNVREDDSAG
jgi:hypothetical protein